MLHLQPSPAVAGDQQDVRTGAYFSSNAMAHTHLATAQLRLPLYLAKNPSVCFSQSEAQFHLHRIRSQTARYYHVVINLPTELLEDMGDILAVPSANDAYDRIKAFILRHITESESSWLRQLLKVEELGVRRVTQMLHSML